MIFNLFLVFKTRNWVFTSRCKQFTSK